MHYEEKNYFGAKMYFMAYYNWFVWKWYIFTFFKQFIITTRKIDKKDNLQINSIKHLTFLANTDVDNILFVYLIINNSERLYHIFIIFLHYCIFIPPVYASQSVTKY